MDEGDRPTDTDESADRDGSIDRETEPNGDVDDVASETSEDAGSGAGLDEGLSDDGGLDEGLSDDGGSDLGDGSGRGDGSANERDRASSGLGADRSDTVDRPTGETDRRGPERDRSLAYRFRHDREGALMWIREMLTSVGVVLLVGLLLFGVSGVWPPMVAVESGSMEPNMRVGDLVFVTEPGRLAPDAAENGIGVVTHERGSEADYRTFGSYGSVVIYSPPGRSASPIIHRAMFRVDEGENWYDRADDRYHDAVDCGSLRNCPAPHDGYITLGDNNGGYDQARGLAPPVRAEWVTGVARARVPYLGYVRLLATGQVELNEAIRQAVGTGVAPAWSPGASTVSGLEPTDGIGPSDGSQLSNLA